MNAGKKQIVLILVFGIANILAFSRIILPKNAKKIEENSFKGMSLKNLEGKFEFVGNSNKKKAYVILFLSPECPLCQSYSLTIKQLYEKYQTKEIAFAAIVPGTDYSLSKIVEYRNGYGLKNIPFYLDPNYAFAKQSKATITPEVFVLNQNNQLVYRGRIDNWAYELGKKRAVITSHDLEIVLQNLSIGKTVQPYQTKAVGCFIN
jgi:thiol-disulfide isomerase/thioredoxin